MAETATLISVLALVVGPASGAIAGLASYRLAARRFRHEAGRTEWQDFKDSFDKQIRLAEERGDREEANRLRKEYEGQLEAWRASRQIEGLAPRTIAQSGPTLTAKETERLRRLLAVSENLAPAGASAESYFYRGNAMYEAGRHPEALEAYDRALALRPDLPDAHCNRGVALESLGRHPEALEAFDRALALRPDDPEAHVNRALALGGLGRHQEALEAYDRALALRPDDPQAMYNKACAHSRLEDGEAALEWLQKAIQADQQYRGKALTDDDFAFLREHPVYGPRFRELVAG